MQEILNNTVIQAIIVFVTTYSGVITGLILFLSKLKKSLKEAENNSASFSLATATINQLKEELAILKQEQEQTLTLLKLVKQRQEVQVCGDKDLIASGKAKSIMELEVANEKNERNDKNQA